MEWIVCFCVSIAILILAIGTAGIFMKTKYRSERVSNSLNVLVSGVFLSSLTIFIPAYYQVFVKEELCVIKTVLLSLYSSLRLFLLDGDFDFIMSHVQDSQIGFSSAYTMLAAILYIVAPFLTFGVVLSFFKNAFAYFDYWGCFFSEVYIFSDLNPKSIALATSLKENNTKRTIVFTNVDEQNEEEIHKLGAIIFKRNMLDVGFHFHSKKKTITFFAIGEDQVENLKQALGLIEQYRERENTSLYVFATRTENELLLSTVDKGKIKVRRVNEVRSLISRLLYDEGIKIFENAVSYDEKEKMISAVVLGMGEHGTEMAKALPWFCQMDGYRVYINLFDQNKNVKTSFAEKCPELMDDAHNKDFITEGEAHYSIDIHEETDVETMEFWEKMIKIPVVTYAYIALGNDEINIRTAVKLRSWFERQGMNPRIDALVRDTDKAKALEGITNYSGQAYRINFIGDLQTSYSEDVILGSDVEEAALARHMKWGEEEAFWKYEYNYQSSVASAIHRKMKILCGLPGADQRPDERKEKDKIALRVLEHRRWNAYMRTEGYVYAEKRNNLAKTHNCLVKFADLSLKEQEKDDD